MIQSATPENSVQLGGKSSVIIAGALAFLLLAALLPLPRPVATSSLPWRFEMLASILILAMTVWLYRHGTGSQTGRLLGQTGLRVVIFSILGFVAWSALSLLWADHAGLAAHHTFIWSIYLSVLVIALILMGLPNGLSTIAAALALCSTILGVLCLIDYVSLTDFSLFEGTLRIRYGKYAELLVTILPFLFAIALYARRKRIFLAIVTAWQLGWLTVMLSLSKGAFLAGIAGHIVVFAGCLVLSRPRVRKRAAILAGTWLAVTIGMQVFSSVSGAINSTTDYISGSADPTRDSTKFRVFTWQVAAKMAADNWMVGVGGDNFGTAFNIARGAQERQPIPGTAEILDWYAAERAHNEPLQIFAELGLVGIILLAIAFGAFVVLLIKCAARGRYHLSPVLWGAIAGMISFIASSMVSSFSFRAIQNGIAFFLIFAMALSETVKNLHPKARQSQEPGSNWLKPVLVAGAILSATTLIYCGAKFAAEYHFYQAERAEDLNGAVALYERGLQIDPDNGNAHLMLGSLRSQQNNYPEAAVSMRRAIDRGLGVTMTYALLAKQQRLAGDTAAAEQTVLEALRIFPGSVYLRVVYAAFLEDEAKHDEAAEQLAIAKSIDPRQANGWHVLIRDGSTAAFYRAQKDPEMAPPAELSPDNAVRQYLDKTP
jgi:O-antigen ligase